jgi:succinoglycan biosynthesis protein ExoA
MKAIDRTEHPLVTVIMPVRNEARSIRKSLESLLTQTYAGERIEILIVDGMSDDGTRRIIEAIRRDHSAPISGSVSDDCGIGKSRPEIRMVDNPSQVVPTALNIGLAQAHGDVILRLDGHSELMPNYVEACVGKLQERLDVACVGGPSVAVGSGWVGQAYALALRSPVGVGGRTFRTLRQESYVDTLAFGAYRKEVFAEIGGFDPQLFRNQDIEFSARLRKAGHRMLLIQTTQTLYHAPEDLATILRQCYNNGYWNTSVLNKMLGALSWRHFAPGSFVASILVLALAAAAWVPARYGLLLLTVSYALAIMSASVIIALRSRQKCAVLLPVVLCALHISYGLGSVLGTFGFVSRSLQLWARRRRE